MIEVRFAGNVVTPIHEWRSTWGDPNDHDLETLAEHFNARWTEELSTVEVYFASRSAANLFGVRYSGIGRPCEWSHDYRLTEVFLHYRAHDPQAADRWRCESAFPKWGKRVKRMKDPDAFLINDQGQVEKVIEVAGKYSAQHLRDLHEHCAGGAYRRIRELAELNGVDDRRNPYGQIEIGYELW